jgi:LuxR family maltose regulon positive regulatory protein
VRVDTAAAYAVIPGGDPLMPAKLRVAQIRSHVLARPRLLDRLQQATRGPLTLITAPAGSGKTVLASSWAATGHAPGPLTWITLEPGDDQPAVFWTYLLEGLARSGVHLPPLPPPARVAATGRSLLTRLCAALSDQAEPAVLVLDNTDVLGPALVADLDFLLRHASPQLRLVALGRTDPPLPLHRYRLDGWLTEIRLDELAFTTPEAQALLAEHDAPLASQDVALLVERTEGWAAGLRLAALALQGRTRLDSEQIVRRFDGSRPEVAEYLLAEVLDPQPAGVREFLLRTSVPDHLPAGLADALGGRDDSAQLLHELAQANAFVRPTEGGFRYHRLFRDLLRTQLAARPADEIVRLHRRAAQWLATDGQVTAAAAHASAAGDWAHAATLVVEGLALGGVLTGTDPQLTEVFADIPDEADSPDAAVLLAALAVRAGDRDRSAAHLARARAALARGHPHTDTTPHTDTGPRASTWPQTDTRAQTDTRPHTDTAPRVDAGPRAGTTPQADTRAVRMAIAAVTVLAADMDTAATAAAEFDQVTAEPGPPPPTDLLAAVRAAAGASLLWTGELDHAEDTLLVAARAADTAGLGRLRARVLGHLALLNATQGRLRRAGKFAFAATRVADRFELSGPDRPAAIDTALAWIYLDRHDLPAARRHARTQPDPDDPVTATALEVLHDRMSHKRTDAGTSRVLPAWLTAARQPTEGSGALTTQVEAWLHRASHELDQGRNDLARQALGRALHLAASESLRRPIAEAPSRLRRFLAQDQELLQRHRWLDGALAIVSTTRSADDTRPAALVEPLTDREHEVLRNMAALLSTDEIARTMFVSVNTVKTHIRGILRKLSANRRNDAIRRARELGLLGPTSDAPPPDAPSSDTDEPQTPQRDR